MTKHESDEQHGVVPTQYMIMREMFQPGITYWICLHRKGPLPSRCELCVPFGAQEQNVLADSADKHT